MTTQSSRGSAPGNVHRKHIPIAVALAIAPLVVYWQAFNHAFIDFYDDVLYVTGNTYVQMGLTGESISWAFTTGFGANWHPLTWISHMLDYQLFGMDPAGHHATSLVFHSLNTVLLFLVLKRMTGTLWQSAFVAALFALHPLHVESVAWVAERKDVLSTCFWLLTMWAYLHYVGNPGPGRYLLVMVALAFGLMSKPMLVTLPFVLLLLDYWPLQRLSLLKDTSIHERFPGKTRKGNRSGANTSVLLRLVREKIPLLILVILSSVITFITQQEGGAVQTIQSMSLPIRLGNAAVSYVKYLVKTVAPTDLSPFYPHPGEGIPFWLVASATVFLLVCTAIAVRVNRKHPYIPVGWFWYLGTLVPVIGLVQVGSQAMADRYTYVPLIGIFFIVAWGGSAVLKKWSHHSLLPGFLAGVTLLALAFSTYQYNQYWRDEITLFTRATDVTTGNWLAHSNLGAALGKRGDHEEAVKHHAEAIRINPAYAEAYYNMGVAQAGLGKKQEAIKYYSEAVRLKPDYPGARNNLGLLLVEQGRVQEGMAQYREALRVQPDYAEAYTNLGSALAGEGKLQEAIRHHREALRFKPGLWSARFHLAVALAESGDIAGAISEYEETIRLMPTFADAHARLGRLRATLGEMERAERHCLDALELNSEQADAQFGLGLVYASRGMYADALLCFSEVLRIRPKDPEARLAVERMRAQAGALSNYKVFFNLGLAAAAEGNQAGAVAYYREALRLNPGNPDVMNVLGASYGRLGDLHESSRLLREAIRLNPALADAHNNLGIVEAMQGRAEEALVHFAEAVRINPNDAGARYNYGLILARQGNIAAAMEQYVHALRIRPDYADAQRELENLQKQSETGRPLR